MTSTLITPLSRFESADAFALHAFLRAQESSRRFQLVLPEFSGPVALSDSSLQYRGKSFAERDTRAASYVQSVLDRVADDGGVTWEPARATLRRQGTGFLFGSRSNLFLLQVLGNCAQPLFQFEFGDLWTIHCGGQSFSLADPSKIDPGVYAASDDYGVIARLGSASPAPSFVIAGLGGRATEGCGYFFRERWRELSERFGRGDFAVVLKFAAPFDVSRAEPVAGAQIQ